MPGHDHPELDDSIEELASAVLGPRKSEFAGGGRYEEEGLMHQVEEINTRLSNGGLRVKLTPGQWGTLVVLTAAVIASLLGIDLNVVAP